MKRMGAFQENFVVAVKDEQIVGFINGGTTDKPVLPDEFYHDITLHRKDGEIQTVFGLNVIPEYRSSGDRRRALWNISRSLRKSAEKKL